MEQIEYLRGENTEDIDNQCKKDNIEVLFLNEEIILEQLAEIVYNSYLRKHPEEREKLIYLNESNPQLKSAA